MARPAHSPTPLPGLRIEPLTPDGLFRRTEAALRASDLEGARQTARQGGALFPGHAALAALADRLSGPSPTLGLGAAGLERPWHLSRIPRKAHFYWGSERTSYLRFLSVASFHLLNPDWELNLYIPASLHRGATDWTTAESYEHTAYHGRDYARRLFSLPGVRLREVDFSAFPALDGAPETFKSDFFRWHILQAEGGLFSDTDILFTRPLREAPFNAAEHRETEAGLCLHGDGHIVGFFLAAPGTPLFERVSREARQTFDGSNYQALGAHLLNRLYPTLEDLAKAHPGLPFLNLPMDLVYPFDWVQIPKLYDSGDPDDLPEGTVGVHWYAGSPYSQRFNNQVDHESCGRFGTFLDRLAARVAARLQAEAAPAPAPSGTPAGPKFSVLVPSYNQAHFLPATLDSLRAQTFEDWEAVVVDDGSVDDTLQVLAAYAAKDPRIRFFHQENGGVGAALNAALAQARGAWICWLSSDDLYEPDALEAFARAISERPTARFFYSNFFQLFEETGEKRPQPVGRQVTLPPFELQTLSLLQANYINGITICIHRGLFDEVGSWNPAYRHAQDLDLWLRMSARTRLHYLDHRTGVTRVHPGQDSRGFPMAGFYDSARAALAFLNEHPFEEIFPWLDLRSDSAVVQAVQSTIEVVANLNAFFYHGVGPNTALLERLGEWIEANVLPDLRDPLVRAVQGVFAANPHLPTFLSEGVRRLGTPEGNRYTRKDPLAMMAGVMHRLEAAGEVQLAADLRRYLDQAGAAPGPGPSAGSGIREACIVLARPEGYSHTEAFREMAQTLEAGFRSLGIPVQTTLNQLREGALNIVLGWHLLDEASALAMPPETVLYNLEQMDETNRELRDRLVRLGQRLTVWDYSPRNQEVLRRAGLTREIGLLPIAYAPALSRIPEAPQQDIDVLFYGSTNPRRIHILEALRAAGLRVHAGFNLYGAERDALIARARLVLNLHYYESSIFELVRVSYLLANRKTVVAECHEATEVDPALRDGLILASYEGLVQACLAALGNEAGCRAVAQRGFERISDRAIVPLLRPLVEARFGLPRRKPKVSVIVPTRDRPEFLDRALRSIQAQTFKAYEVVVVNDGGAGVSEVAARARARGMDLTVIDHPRPLGQAAARNTGIRAARGAWIAYLDDDDRYFPDHLQTLMDTLRTTGARVAYTDSMRVIEENQGGTWVDLGRELAMSHAFDRDHFLRDNLTPVNNVVHARACWEEIGPHDETLPVLEDWDYWIRLSRRWDFVHIPKATAEVRWRKSGANVTFERRDLFPVCRERIARKVAALLAAETAAAAARGKDAFLHEPDWREAGWAEVLLAYLEAFPPEAPVRLVLPLDPGREDQLPLEEAQAAVLDLVRRSGREAFPEVVLVDQPVELAEMIRGFDRVQWIPGAAGAPWPLLGPGGQALNEARARLRDEVPA